MTAEAEPVTSGWRIETAFAASVAARPSRNFYAVHARDAFGHAERGVCALQLGLVSSAESHAKSPKTALFTQLRLWQPLTILFAATTLFLLLRDIR